jgi:hypothetical protein
LRVFWVKLWKSCLFVANLGSWFFIVNSLWKELLHSSLLALSFRSFLLFYHFPMISVWFFIRI